MAFYSTIGYKFAQDEAIVPSGSVLLAGAMAAHQLGRRNLRPEPPKRKTAKPRKVQYPHMQTLLFDPQLYLAGLEAHQSRQRCANLATYPWFGISSQLQAYDSSEQTQSDWTVKARERIASIWPSRAPTEAAEIALGVQACVDLQLRLGCEAIILPSPLTYDPSTDYRIELDWLDAGISYAKQATEVPVYATVALSDLCFRYSPPESNQFIEMLTDAVSARGVAGVYVVIEQGSEPADAKQCGNARVLASALHLTHLFAKDASLDVAVNFLGVFGVACAAAGARLWSSAWYKSLHRVRLADSSDGRAYPSYWTGAAAFDVNLDTDFDALVAARLLPQIADRTLVSGNLLDAASKGISSHQVAPWTYQQSNVAAALDHFLHSAIATDHWLTATAPDKRVDAVETWLKAAARTAQKGEQVLGGQCKSRLRHVPAWLEAFQIYRRIHSV
jgi:hypothetical protein